MEVSFAPAVVILLLVMDPVGNIPLFVALLKPVEPGRRAAIIVPLAIPSIAGPTAIATVMLIQDDYGWC